MFSHLKYLNLEIVRNERINSVFGSFNKIFTPGSLQSNVDQVAAIPTLRIMIKVTRCAMKLNSRGETQRKPEITEKLGQNKIPNDRKRYIIIINYFMNILSLQLHMGDIWKINTGWGINRPRFDIRTPDPIYSRVRYVIRMGVRVSVSVS